MAPKKQKVNEHGESSNPARGFDPRIFVSAAAQALYQFLSKKIVIHDQGLEYQDKPYHHDPKYNQARRHILARGWQLFVDVTGQSNVSMALEFLANWPERVDGIVRLRRKNV